MKHKDSYARAHRRAANHERHMNLLLSKRRAKEKRAKQARKITRKA